MHISAMRFSEYSLGRVIVNMMQCMAKFLHWLKSGQNIRENKEVISAAHNTRLNNNNNNIIHMFCAVISFSMATAAIFIPQKIVVLLLLLLLLLNIGHDRVFVLLCHHLVRFTGDLLCKAAI